MASDSEEEAIIQICCPTPQDRELQDFSSPVTLVNLSLECPEVFRWSLVLQLYNIEVKHKNKNNVVVGYHIVLV